MSRRPLTRGDAGFVWEEIERIQAENGTLAHPRRLIRPYGGGQLERGPQSDGRRLQRCIRVM